MEKKIEENVDRSGNRFRKEEEAKEEIKPKTAFLWVKLFCVNSRDKGWNEGKKSLRDASQAYPWLFTQHLRSLVSGECVAITERVVICTLLYFAATPGGSALILTRV